MRLTQNNRVGVLVGLGHAVEGAGGVQCGCCLPREGREMVDDVTRVGRKVRDVTRVGRNVRDVTR